MTKARTANTAYSSLPAYCSFEGQLIVIPLLYPDK